MDSVTKAGQSPSYIIHDPDSPLLVVQPNNGTENYYLPDNLGSPTAPINISNVATAAYSLRPVRHHPQRHRHVGRHLHQPRTISRLADPTNGHLYA